MPILDETTLITLLMQPFTNRIALGYYGIVMVHFPLGAFFVSLIVPPLTLVLGDFLLRLPPCKLDHSLLAHAENGGCTPDPPHIPYDADWKAYLPTEPYTLFACAQLQPHQFKAVFEFAGVEISFNDLFSFLGNLLPLRLGLWRVHNRVFHLVKHTVNPLVVCMLDEVDVEHLSLRGV